MRELDWKRVKEAKDAHRDQLAARPFAEKLKTLERMRERTRAIGGPVSGRQGQLATVSNAHVSVMPAPVGQASRSAITTAFFGAASGFAFAITPPEAKAASATVVRKPKSSR